MSVQTLRERFSEVLPGRVCADCRHDAHASGSCRGCNCGEAEIVRTAGELEWVTFDSDVETERYLSNDGEWWEDTRGDDEDEDEE